MPKKKTILNDLEQLFMKVTAQSNPWCHFSCQLCFRLQSPPGTKKRVTAKSITSAAMSARSTDTTVPTFTMLHSLLVVADSSVSKIACCPGSGRSVLVDCTQADVWITGEMSHHDVLDAVHSGITVVLCDHSNSERGFLRHVRDVLDQKFNEGLEGKKVEVKVSQVDKDPLMFV